MYNITYSKPVFAPIGTLPEVSISAEGDGVRWNLGTIYFSDGQLRFRGNDTNGAQEDARTFVARVLADASMADKILGLIRAQYEKDDTRHGVLGAAEVETARKALQIAAP